MERGSGGAGGGTPRACDVAVSDGSRVCVDLVSAAWASCYADSNAPCSADDADIAAALAQPGPRAAGDLELRLFDLDADPAEKITSSLLGIRSRRRCAARR